jgi:hypothetical protein
MSEFRFRVRGEQAESVAEELAGLLGDELKQRVPVTREPSADAAQGTRGDPVAVATLVLSIPCAVLATVDLVERVRKAETLRKLVAWARQRRSAAVEVTGPTGRVQQLAEADPGELLDEAAQSQDKGANA